MKELCSLLFSDSIEELHYWPSSISAFCENFNVSESRESSGQVFAQSLPRFYINNYYNLYFSSCFFCL